MSTKSKVSESVDLGRTTGQVCGQEQQPRAGGGQSPFMSPTRPASPMTAADIATGLQRMADFLDPDLAARKVAMDHASSRPPSKRNDDNG